MAAVVRGAVPGERRLSGAGLEHVDLGLERAAEPGGAPAAGAVEGGHGVGEAALAVGEARRQPGTGRIVLREPGERRPRDSRLVYGEAEGGQPGRARFQRGERAAAVSRAPQRGGAAVRSGDG